MKNMNQCVLAAVAAGLVMAGGSYLLMPGIKPLAMLVIGFVGAAGAFKAAMDIAAKRKTIESK